MKKIATILIFLISFVSSYGQVTTTNTPGAAPRSGRSVKDVEDFNLGARTNLFVPRMLDTTQANTNNNSFDTCGRIVYTYDADAFWVRRCFPAKHWELIGSGGSGAILPQCGITKGTAVVTYDSLLVFDVTAALYALCCDNQTRTTRDTTITLDAADPDNPRLDAIILDQNGVNIVKGIASANPAIPQTDSCQLVLTYVLIQAGQTTPANISQVVVYDENDYVTNVEWPLDSLSQVTADTADITTPVHLIHDIAVSNYTTGGYMIFTSPETIDLNSYNALKLYVNKNAGVLVIGFSFYLDGVQKTSLITRSIPAALSGSYITIVIPIQDFAIFGTDEVNKLRISLTGPNSPLFIDWIQLQAGVGPVTAIEGIQSISGSNNSIMNLNFTNGNGPNTQGLIPLRNQAAYTLFRNESNISAVPVFGKLDLSQDYFTGFLPVALLSPDGNDGDYVGQEAGVVGFHPFQLDTTFIGNGLVRRTDPNSNNDTLYLGYSKVDTALLAFDTHLGFNGHFFQFDGNGSLILGSEGTFPPFANRLDVLATTGVAAQIAIEDGLGLLINANGTSAGGVSVSITAGDIGSGISSSVLVSNGGGIGIGFTTTIEADNPTGILSTANNPVNNSVIVTNILQRGVTNAGAGAAGIGQQLSFNSVDNATATTFTNGIISKLTVATHLSSTSQMIITGVLGGATGDILTLNGDKSIQITPITATAASAITPSEGMIVFVSNTNGTFLAVGFWGYQGGLWVKM